MAAEIAIWIKTYNMVSSNPRETNGFEFYILVLVPGGGTPVMSPQKQKCGSFHCQDLLLPQAVTISVGKLEVSRGLSGSSG